MSARKYLSRVNNSDTIYNNLYGRCSILYYIGSYLMHGKKGKDKKIPQYVFRKNF